MSRRLLVLLLVGGCRGCEDDPGAGELGKSDMCTAAVVNWTTEEPATSVVAYGTSEDYGQVSPGGEELVTDHSVLVAGLSPNATWHFQARSVTADGTELVGEDLVQETCYPPATAPEIYPGVFDADNSNGGQILINTVALTSTVELINEDFELTWWTDLGNWTVAQARPSRDHMAIIINVAAGDHTRDIGEIIRYRLDKQEVVHTTTPHGHHDFVELEDGGYAYIKVDIRDDLGGAVDEEECVANLGELANGRHCVAGDSLVEIAEDGTLLREVWNSWDNLPMTATAENDTDFYPQAWDWVHANGLDMTEDAYYLSSHALSAVFKIDRATGNQVWQLGGEGSDMVLTSGEASVEQHSPRWIQDSPDEPGHLFVFNNRQADYSNVIEYEVDEEAMTYAQVWLYDRDGESHSLVLGSVERTENDHRVIAWGTNGAFEEVDANMEVVRSFTTSLGFPLGNAHPFEPLGGPLK